MAKRGGSSSRLFGTASVVRFVHADGQEYQSQEQRLAEARERLEEAAAIMQDDSTPALRLGGGGGGFKSPARMRPLSAADAKKKKSPGRQKSPMQERESPARDSMKSRLSPGRPGSRRHQRWLNERRLTPAEPFDEEELRELFRVEWRSYFADVLASKTAMAAVEPFLDTTEEDESKHLEYAEPSTPAYQRPVDRMARMDARARRILQRGVGHEFSVSFEESLIEHMDSDDKADLRLTANTSMERLLIHAVCDYYLLRSVSSNGKNGKRVTTVKRPRRRNFELPTMPLVTVLPALVRA